MVIMMDMAIVLVMTLTGMMITALVAAMMGCGMVMLVVVSREVGAPSITPQGTSPQPLSDLLEPLSHCLIMRLPISSNCEWPFM